MPLTQDQEDEVVRSEALLSGLSDEDKQAVVRMAYVDNKKPLETAIAEKRVKLEGINDRRARVDELATRVGFELEPVVTVDTQVTNLVGKFGKAAVQAALDLLP